MILFFSNFWDKGTATNEHCARCSCLTCAAAGERCRYSVEGLGSRRAGDAVISHIAWVGFVTGLGLLLGACTSSAPALVGVNPGGEPEYVIGPGDALNVFIYRVPELTAEVPVRPDGYISTPLVPDVLALGKTPTQLAADIQDRLKQY